MLTIGLQCSVLQMLESGFFHAVGPCPRLSSLLDTWSSRFLVLRLPRRTHIGEIW
jgi:hypothetical protein